MFSDLLKELEGTLRLRHSEIGCGFSLIEIRNHSVWNFLAIFIPETAVLFGALFFVTVAAMPKEVIKNSIHQMKTRLLCRDIYLFIGYLH
jgi:hypothetical protein